MNGPAATLVLLDDDRAALERWTRVSGGARVAVRARIVLMAAEGIADEQIAATVGLSVGTVRTWRRRYQTSGIPALERVPRGRPCRVDHHGIAFARLVPGWDWALPPETDSPAQPDGGGADVVDTHTPPSAYPPVNGGVQA